MTVETLKKAVELQEQLKVMKYYKESIQDITDITLSRNIPFTDTIPCGGVPPFLLEEAKSLLIEQAEKKELEILNKIEKLD